MKTLVFLVLLFFSQSWATGPCFNTALLGTWKFTELIYEGHTVPAPNPNLDLRFTFQLDRTSILRWFRTDEAGFCERKALFEVHDDQWLYQKVTWLHPDNDSSCSSDVDMRLGRETFTQYAIEDDKLLLYFDLDGKPLIYVLSRIHSTNNRPSLGLSAAQF